MEIAILTGEPSGDLVGASLASAILEMAPDAHLWGLGSHAMAAAGVELLADSASWSAIGVVASLAKVPPLLLKIAPMLRKTLRERRPNVVVLIDFGAFNVPIARYCKQIGLNTLYYIPPGCWRREAAEGGDVVDVTDVVALPFPWGLQRYNQGRARAFYVGHPLLDRVAPKMNRESFAQELGLSPNAPIIGLLPGSRKHEVYNLLPTLIESAYLIVKEMPKAQFVVGVAPNLSQDQIVSLLEKQKGNSGALPERWRDFTQKPYSKRINPKRNPCPALATQHGMLLPSAPLSPEPWLPSVSLPPDPPIVLAKGLSYEIMAHSDVLLVCSGTATLEAAVLLTPMIVLYKVSKWMELEYLLRRMDKKLRQIRHIGLPNILAERSIVPEMLQQNANPKAIAERALQLLTDLCMRKQMRQDLQSVRSLLGEPGASLKTARLVLALASNEELPNE